MAALQPLSFKDVHNFLAQEQGLWSDGIARCLIPPQEQSRRRQAHQQKLRTKFLRQIKLAVGCIDCGYRENPRRLHFDHRPGTEKRFNPSDGANNKPWEAILIEINKCDVRCASCHRIKHSKEKRVA